MKPLMGVSILVFLGLTIPCVAGTTPTKRTPKAPVDNTIYQVIQIQDAAGVVTFQAIDKTQIQAKRNELNKQFQDAQKSWSDERDAFAKSYPDQKFCKPLPISPLVTVGTEEKDKTKAEAKAQSAQDNYNRTHFQVVKIQDTTGTVTFQVIESAQIQSKREELYRQFSDALKPWTDERDAFTKSNPGKKFDKPAPLTPALTLLTVGEKDKADAATKSYQDNYTRDHPDPNSTPKKAAGTPAP